MSLRDPASLIRHYADSSDLDVRTSMADARMALCVARGVDLDDIDPTTGYNYSRTTYDRVRQSWVSNIKYHGFSDSYDGDSLRRAVADWTASRPDFIADDDWLAAAADAHRAYWTELGRPCPRSTCDLHTTATQMPVQAVELIPNMQGSPFETDHKVHTTVNVHTSA